MTSPGLGPAHLRRLRDHFGSAQAVLDAPRSRLDGLRLKSDTLDYWRAPDPAPLRHAQNWLEQPGHQILLDTDPAYPQRLHDLSDAPPVLFYLGDIDLLGVSQLAMVGSRNPTPAGQRHAQQFAKHLAAQGLGITSGLALGVDAAAHQGALDAQGMTIAVTGTGLDRVYPASNRNLAASIRDHGLLISEFPPGTAARRDHFPRRNRLIAALSLGTLVIEAALRSGSLITARLAGELGREVFAMPGSVDNPLARGCHRLIRQGAKLVETADDILEELGPLLDNVAKVVSSSPRETPSDVHDKDYQHLLKHLDNAPRSIDELADQTGLAVDAVSSMLLILELRGDVSMAPGGGYQKCRP